MDYDGIQLSLMKKIPTKDRQILNRFHNKKRQEPTNYTAITIEESSEESEVSEDETEIGDAPLSRWRNNSGGIPSYESFQRRRNRSLRRKQTNRNTFVCHRHHRNTLGLYKRSHRYVHPYPPEFPMHARSSRKRLPRQFPEAILQMPSRTVTEEQVYAQLDQLSRECVELNRRRPKTIDGLPILICLCILVIAGCIAYMIVDEIMVYLNQMKVEDMVPLNRIESDDTG